MFSVPAIRDGGTAVHVTLCGLLKWEFVVVSLGTGGLELSRLQLTCDMRIHPCLKQLCCTVGTLEQPEVRSRRAQVSLEEVSGGLYIQMVSRQLQVQDSTVQVQS